jgi:hypothetical protein
MDMIADRLIAARDAGWEDVDDDGHRLNRTLGFAVSSSSSSHSVPCGRRYLTLYSRAGCSWSWREAEPLGHRRPREIGESGRPRSG